MATIKIKDYVLATKYRDGYSKDPWAVGFLESICSDGKFILEGQTYRYGRGMKISQEVGDFLLANREKIEDDYFKSLYTLVRLLKNNRGS